MNVLFVCTGNSCRSAMAESIMRRIAAARGLGQVQAGSAGTAAWEGAPASDGALLVAMERGDDLSAHRARVLTRELVAGADLILVMSPHHLERGRTLGGDGKTYLITEYASRGTTDRAVGDPFGGELSDYRTTYEELEREIELVLDRIAAESPGVP